MAYTTIDDPEAYFQVELYTGTGSALSTTFDGDTDMQPDLVWIKNRSATQSHILVDAVRGANKYLGSNHTGAEGTDIDSVTAFGSDGFTVGDDASVSGSGNSMVAWCWKESATAGFDIVSYTGTGSAHTESHSLSAVPKMILFKNRATTANWKVFHAGIGATKWLKFDTTDAAGTSSGNFNDTEPTSSVFTVGTDAGTNGNTNATIAYAFAEKQGFSKFGSYTGNGNADGAFIYTGFRPAWIVVKRTDSANSWMIYDAKRNPINLADNPLYAESNIAEGTSSAASFDFLSNGFKCRGTGSSMNASGATHIYMAFAEAPFVNSNGVPCNAR